MERRTHWTGVAVSASGVSKRYGSTRALDGLDLDVPRGTVHGLLGPNGAGKTTAVRVLTTLTRMDDGGAQVAGLDVSTQARAVRRRIGLTGQQTAVDDVLSARQNLMMFGRLFRLTKADARTRADELLDYFGLAGAADRSPKTFSDGMRRRLDLAASMILAPEVLFLDEPTTGLDPAGRREVWQAIRDLTDGGTTVLLTTHYLDEADQLCDRISVIDRGRNIVEDNPSGLKKRMGNEQLEAVAADPDGFGELTRLVAGLGTAEPVTDTDTLTVTVPVHEGVTALTELATRSRAAGIRLADLGLRRPTLDEAFLALTAGNTPTPQPEPTGTTRQETPR